MIDNCALSPRIPAYYVGGGGSWQPNAKPSSARPARGFERDVRPQLRAEVPTMAGLYAHDAPRPRKAVMRNGRLDGKNHTVAEYVIATYWAALPM